jgi:transcriptional regulator with XRE-family HTH domain
MPKSTGSKGLKFEKEVGKRIKEIRSAANLSQTALGDKLGVSFQQMQKYENGTNRMSAYRLLQTANALKVDIRYFYGLLERKRKAARRRT